MSELPRIIEIDDNTHYMCKIETGSICASDYEKVFIYLDDKNKQLEQELDQAKEQRDELAKIIKEIAEDWSIAEMKAILKGGE